MREDNKKTEYLKSEAEKYSEEMGADYCEFRLKTLAKKIKSTCFKQRRPETNLLNI